MTTNLESKHKELMEEFEELTYKWAMAISPTRTYEEEVRTLFDSALSQIAQVAKEEGFKDGATLFGHHLLTIKDGTFDVVKEAKRFTKSFGAYIQLTQLKSPVSTEEKKK